MVEWRSGRQGDWFEGDVAMAWRYVVATIVEFVGFAGAAIAAALDAPSAAVSGLLIVAFLATWVPMAVGKVMIISKNPLVVARYQVALVGGGGLRAARKTIAQARGAAGTR